jgi:hypothetical protein
MLNELIESPTLAYNFVTKSSAHVYEVGVTILNYWVFTNVFVALFWQIFFLKQGIVLKAL